MCSADDVTVYTMCCIGNVFVSFDDTAESKCGEYCGKALQYSGSNPEAYQLMGSYLLSKQECEVSSNHLVFNRILTSLQKARSTLLQGLSLWLPSSQGGDDGGAGIDLQQVNSLYGSHDPVIDHVINSFHLTNPK